VFIVYGGILVYSSEDVIAIEFLNFLTDNYHILSILNLISLVILGILLAVLVLAIHQRFNSNYQGE